MEENNLTVSSKFIELDEKISLVTSVVTLNKNRISPREIDSYFLVDVSKKMFKTSSINQNTHIHNAFSLIKKVLKKISRKSVQSKVNSRVILFNHESYEEVEFEYVSNEYVSSVFKRIMKKYKPLKRSGKTPQKSKPFLPDLVKTRKKKKSGSNSSILHALQALRKSIEATAFMLKNENNNNLERELNIVILTNKIIKEKFQQELQDLFADGGSDEQNEYGTTDLREIYNLYRTLIVKMDGILNAETCVDKLYEQNERMKVFSEMLASGNVLGDFILFQKEKEETIVERICKLVCFPQLKGVFLVKNKENENVEIKMKANLLNFKTTSTKTTEQSTETVEDNMKMDSPRMPPIKRNSEDETKEEPITYRCNIIVPTDWINGKSEKELFFQVFFKKWNNFPISSSSENTLKLLATGDFILATKSYIFSNLLLLMYCDLGNDSELKENAESNDDFEKDPLTEMEESVEKKEKEKTSLEVNKKNNPDEEDDPIKEPKTNRQLAHSIIQRISKILNKKIFTMYQKERLGKLHSLSELKRLVCESLQLVKSVNESSTYGKSGEMFEPLRMHSLEVINFLLHKRDIYSCKPGIKMKSKIKSIKEEILYGLSEVKNFSVPDDTENLLAPKDWYLNYSKNNTVYYLGIVLNFTFPGEKEKTKKTDGRISKNGVNLSTVRVKRIHKELIPSTKFHLNVLFMRGYTLSVFPSKQKKTSNRNSYEDYVSLVSVNLLDKDCPVSMFLTPAYLAPDHFSSGMSILEVVSFHTLGLSRDRFEKVIPFLTLTRGIEDRNEVDINEEGEEVEIGESFFQNTLSICLAMYDLLYGNEGVYSEIMNDDSSSFGNDYGVGSARKKNQKIKSARKKKNRFKNNPSTLKKRLIENFVNYSHDELVRSSIVNTESFLSKIYCAIMRKDLNLKDDGELKRSVFPEDFFYHMIVEELRRRFIFNINTFYLSEENPEFRNIIYQGEKTSKEKSVIKSIFNIKIGEDIQFYLDFFCKRVLIPKGYDFISSAVEKGMGSVSIESLSSFGGYTKLSSVIRDFIGLFKKEPNVNWRKNSSILTIYHRDSCVFLDVGNDGLIKFRGTNYKEAKYGRVDRSVKKKKKKRRKKGKGRKSNVNSPMNCPMVKKNSSGSVGSKSSQEDLEVKTPEKNVKKISSSFSEYYIKRQIKDQYKEIVIIFKGKLMKVVLEQDLVNFEGFPEIKQKTVDVDFLRDYGEDLKKIIIEEKQENQNDSMTFEEEESHSSISDEFSIARNLVKGCERVFMNQIAPLFFYKEMFETDFIYVPDKNTFKFIKLSRKMVIAVIMQNLFNRSDEMLKENSFFGKWKDAKKEYEEIIKEMYKMVDLKKLINNLLNKN